MTTTTLLRALLLGGIHAGVLLAAIPAPCEEAVPPAELSEETRQIRAELKDVGLRLERLAKGLEEKQPDEAKRMLEAVGKIHRADLGRALDDISALLLKASFVEALGRQERAIEELDAIIALLERAQFDPPENLDARAEALKEVRKAASELAKKQSSLLERTRRFLDAGKALEAIEALKRELASIQEAQSGLNRGEDPEKLDPESQKADASALEKAQAQAQELEAAQEKLNRERGSLPQENLPIGALRELVERMDALLEEGQKLATDTRQSAEEAGELGRLVASKPRDAKSSAAGARSKDGSKTEDGSRTEDGSPAEKASRTENGAKSDGSKSDGSRTENGSRTEDGSKTENGDRAEDGKEPGETGPSPTEGPSAVELARKSEQANARRAALARQGKEFAENVADLARAAGAQDGTPPETARSSASAAEKAADVARELEREGARPEPAQADLKPAMKGQQGALDDLKKARDAALKELAGLEEKNNAATAGLTQEQAVLEDKTTSAAQESSNAAEKATSDAARSALDRASKAMAEASRAMSGATQSEKSGDRAQAQADGEKARAELGRARAELDKGRQELAARTAAQKAAELQKKIAKKTAEAQARAAELQKKLRRKDEARAGEGAAKSQDSLGKASQAMEDAARAQSQGDGELSKKKGEDAMSELARAEAALADEAKSELERLKKEKERLKASTPEQEKLAKLTKELAKKSRSSGADSSSDSSEGLEEAGQDMEQAAEELGEEQAENARKEQEEALARLKQAQKELQEEEEKLAQLKREQEMLSLVQALAGVKEAEEKILADTIKANTGREANESRRQRARVEQAVSPIARRQEELAVEVDDLTGKLQAEMARVFTFVLKNVSSDMRQVRDSLKELDTGSYTQFLQKEIAADVERLLAALKEELDKQQQQQQQPQGQQQEQPQGQPRLLPPVAELRMLRDMQTSVNKSTRDLEDIRKASDGGVSDTWKKALDRLLQKQGSVSGMTAEILKDFQETEAAPGENGATDAEAKENDHGHEH